MPRKLNKILHRLIRKNFFIAYSLDYRRYRRLRDPAREPLIVFQMGKVGSSTLVTTLSQMGIEQEIYQIHFLADEWINRVYHMYKDASKVRGRPIVEEHLMASRYLRDLIDRSRGAKWKVITLIRDPIARNISAFFQAFPIHYPEVTKRFKTAAPPAQEKANEMIRLFLDDFDKHNVPIEWFDRHMKPAFGIDVYEEEFDPTLGHHIYHNERADLLLIRLENLRQSAGQALGIFMNLDHISLRNANISEDKSYSEEYKLFKANVSLPRSYIDSMYETKYMRHFFSEEEIERLRAKWGRA